MDGSPLPLKTAEDVARELLSQPAFFLEFDGVKGLTVPPPALQRYTGDRSTSEQHELRNLKIGALRLLGASDRQIEEACHVTRRTIPLILADLEKSGRITPLKQRLAMATGNNAERANIALRVLLDRAAEGGESMELAGMIKAVATALGITTEKLLLLTGQATEIVETRSGVGREEFETWWRNSVRPAQASDVTVPSATTPATDSGSGATVPVSEQITQPEPIRDGSDTAAREPDPKRLDGGGGDGHDPGGATGPMS